MKQSDLTHSQIDLFEAYASNKMGQDELARFSHSLAQDQNLQDLYRAYLLSKQAIDLKIAASLKEKMKTWNESSQTPVISISKTTSAIKYLKWAAAASVLFFISLGVVQHNKINSFADNQINALLPLGEFSQRGAESNSQVEKAYGKYIASNYNKEIFIVELKKVTASDQEYNNAQMELGKLYINQGKCSEAKNAFANVNEAENETASLGLLLCHVKCNDLNQEFTDRLNKLLADKNHPNHGDAVRISNQINGFWWKLFH